MNTSSEIQSICANMCNNKEAMMKRNLIILYLILAWFIAIPVYAFDDGVESLRLTGKAFASVAQEVSPSVVFIRVESKASASNIAQFAWPFGHESPFGDDLFKHFFDDQFPGSPKGPQPKMPQGKRRTIGQGSGFVFSAKDGLLSDKTYILTNNHVVENADKILVKLQDEREFEAKITGRDPKSDVAVLEINIGGLPALSFADSSQIDVGEWVVAIGNPFGLSIANYCLAYRSNNVPTSSTSASDIVTGPIILMFNFCPPYHSGSQRSACQVAVLHRSCARSKGKLSVMLSISSFASANILSIQSCLNSRYSSPMDINQAFRVLLVMP